MSNRSTPGEPAVIKGHADPFQPATGDQTAEDPVLDIVIVTATGGRELVRDCLASLERHPLRHGHARVHVVDNASCDGTVAMIAEHFPGVHVHALTWNSGFAYANNIVLAHTTSPYALLLNPDTEAREGTLDHCLDAMEARSDVGLLGCRLVQPDGTFDHAAKRSFPTPIGALVHFLRIGRGRATGALAQYRAPEVGEFDPGEVDAVNGAFMLVRRRAMEEVGLLDESYWMYMEDLDWCYRFKRRGWRVWYDGRVSFVHVKGGLSKTREHRALRTNAAFHRGMGRFYRKFQSGDRAVLDLAVYLAIGAKLTISAIRSGIARRSLR